MSNSRDNTTDWVIGVDTSYPEWPVEGSSAGVALGSWQVTLPYIYHVLLSLVLQKFTFKNSFLLTSC